MELLYRSCFTFTRTRSLFRHWSSPARRLASCEIRLQWPRLSCCWSLLRLVTWVRVSCWELLKSAEESVESAMQEVRSSRWSLVLARRTIAWQCGQIKNSRRSLERLESRGSVGAEDFVCIGLCMEIALCISPYTCLCISMCIDAFVMILFV